MSNNSVGGRFGTVHVNTTLAEAPRGSVAIMVRVYVPCDPDRGARVTEDADTETKEGTACVDSAWAFKLAAVVVVSLLELELLSLGLLRSLTLTAASTLCA